MRGYKVTVKGLALIERLLGEDSAWNEGEIEPLELAKCLCALVDIDENCYFTYEQYVDEIQPHFVKLLERRGYIEKSLVPVVESYLEYKRLRGRI